MTSYFFDGTTLGDASEAPYDDGEYNNFFSILTGSGEPYVLAQYLSDLAVETGDPVNGAITIRPGAAVINGCLYINDAEETIILPNNTDPVNPRIDYVCLHYEAGAVQTIRIEAVYGTPAALPAYPTLTQTADDYYMPLAAVWIPGGFVAAPIANEYIYDKRRFLDTSSSIKATSKQNYLSNSEFLLYSNGHTGSIPPDGWKLLNTPTVARANLAGDFDNIMARGNLVTVLGTTNDGIYASFYTPSSSTGYDKNKPLTIQLYLQVASGSVKVHANSRASGGPTGTFIEEEHFPQFNGYDTVLLRLTNFSNNELVEIQFIISSAGTEFTFGQVIAVAGYETGGYRQIHELILADYDLLDANWTASAKSTGATTVSAHSGYNGNIVRGMRGLFMKTACRDSGAAGGNASLQTGLNSAAAGRYTSRVDCGRIVNDTWRQGQSFVPVRRNDSNVDFIADVTATGAGTLDGTLQIIGLVT